MPSTPQTDSGPAKRGAHGRVRIIGRVVARCPVCLTDGPMELCEYRHMSVHADIETEETEEPCRRLACRHCPWSTADHLPSVEQVTPQSLTAENATHLIRVELPWDYALLEKARQSPSSLTGDQRKQALAAPFAALADAAEFESSRQLGATPMNILNAAVMMGGLFLAFVSALQTFHAPSGAVANVPALILLPIGIVAFVVGARHFLTHNRRVVKNRMLGPIADAIRPLRPLDHEVAEALKTQRDNPIGALKPLLVIEAVRTNR